MLNDGLPSRPGHGQPETNSCNDDVFEEGEDRASSTGSMSVTTSQEKEEDNDGHRPTLREVRSTISRHSRHRAESSTSATTAPTTSIARRDTIVSRIRSRQVSQFTHPLAHIPTTEEQIVDFDGPDDPYRPLNWSTHKKVSTTLLYGLVTMTATWASSAYSAGTSQVAEEFHVSTQVSVLGTTLVSFRISYK